VIALQAVALWTGAHILPGVDLDGFGSSVIVAVVLLAVVLLLWPIFVRFFFKLAIYTGGLITVLMNGLIFQIADWMSRRVYIHSFGWAILYSLLATVIMGVLLGVFSFQDAGTMRRIALWRKRRKIDPAVVGKVGVIFVEIDGLSHDALLRAMAAGKAPAMKRWSESGSHRLAAWETDLSSQTSASQAGILQGNNAEIPAFRWFDKSQGRIFVSSSLSTLGPLEKSLSDGNGLLAGHGAARACMFSGDAAEVMLVASRPTEERSESYRSFFASPLIFTHTLFLVIWEMILETGAKWTQRIRKVHPRLDRHFKYTIVRAGMTVALRDLSLSGVIGDMLLGLPYCYCTLAGYDEVAHHSGLDRHDTLEVLRKIDSRLHSLETIARISPREYEFVILSDHGQTQGATFLQRYGLTLEDLVRESVSQGTLVGGPSTYAEEGAGAGVARGQSDWEHMATVDEAVQESGLGASRLGKAIRKRLQAQDAPPEVVTDLVVMASGNLGLVSFTGPSHRLTLEEIERDQPDLISKLTTHPGIGFVMVATSDGGVIIGREGRRSLSDDLVEGIDPLTLYGPNAARHLRRVDSYRNCPGLLVMSTYWPETDEDAAFEELIANHGGLGGEQTRPFLLYPAKWELGETELVGAEAVYRNLKRWTALTA